MKIYLEVETTNKAEVESAVRFLNGFIIQTHQSPGKDVVEDRNIVQRRIDEFGDDQEDPVIMRMGLNIYPLDKPMPGKAYKGKLADPASEKQKDYIDKLVVDGYLLREEVPFKGMTKETASNLILKAKERRSIPHKDSTVCSISDCTKQSKVKGYCTKHYQQQRKMRMKLKGKGGDR